MSSLLLALLQVSCRVCGVGPDCIHPRNPSGSVMTPESFGR